MIKRLLGFIGLLFFVTSIFGQGTIEGKVIEKGTGDAVPFGSVLLYKNGVLITGAESDLDGNFLMSDVAPGKYDLVASNGIAETRINGIVMKAGGTIRQNLEIDSAMLDVVTISTYKVPLIEIDNTTQGQTITAEKIANMPVKNLNSIVATAAGISSADGSRPNIRGSRNDETIYFIDGIRSSSNLPASEIEQLQIVTGGVEAKYGDVSGGIISSTSKGPSQEFSGGIELETSQFLDPYGYNLLSANLSGPILKNKKNNRSILGYRFSGQYVGTKDNGPSAVGVYRAPESVIRQLEENPFYNFNGTLYPVAEQLTNSDIGSALKARPNEDNNNINITGKIDARISDNIDIQLSGNFEKDKDRFTPGSNLNGRSWAMLNWTNNPYNYTDRIRTNFRFRHKLGKQNLTPTTDGGDKGVSSSIFRNLSYTIQLGFERGNGRSEDLQHEDRFFEYGYFGNIPTVWDTIVGPGPSFQNPDSTIIRHLGYTPVESEFIPGVYNPVLAKYNTRNGVLENNSDVIWSNLYANVGQVYNSYNKNQNDLTSFNFNLSFDLVPGSLDRGKHNLQFGLVYEQRFQSNYTLSPFGLYRLGDISVNNHITGIDPTDSIGTITVQGFTVPVYNTLVQANEDSRFYKEIRDRNGIDIHEFVNLSSFTPDRLTLDMFSARELTDQGLISYRGYDYLGNKIGNDVSFDDYFTAKDENGKRTYPVGAFKPIYAGGYLQDKFSYKDIIFRLGVRMDYYDANTKVLKDPYSPYEIETAEAFYARTGQVQPASVGDDYKVYVTGAESDAVVGYRKENQWFLPNGTAVTNGNKVFNGAIVNPSYVGRFTGRVLDIQRPDFDVNTSFEDYKAQINWMPRLAFSFPISTDANFFAHYDVLYQRPPSGVVATAQDYFYFNNVGSRGAGNPFPNPNLKPIRTTSYEAGFQQKISSTSALKVSAYYKENKDLIQAVAYTNVPSPINLYYSYGNLDFGTTKGFSFQLDRRRVNNLEMTATYTLQFADGSGSDANSSAGINSRGPIRSLIPLSFDERHRFTANVDYRFDSGKAYDGPVIAGMDILSNTGINFTAIGVSGQPYSANSVAAQFGGSGFKGGINEARLPWQFSVDARIDKSFNFKPSASAKKAIVANIYLRVNNVLDVKNVVGVYGYSGDPDNDGYLTSSFGIDRVTAVDASGRDLQAFLDSYSWRMNAPGNYLQPRRLYLGILFNL